VGRKPGRNRPWPGHFIGGAQCSNPQWSPVNDHIILFNSRLQGSSDLYLLDLSIGQYKRITTDPSDEVEASWSSNGKWIYFGSNRTGQMEIWKMPAEGGAWVRITNAGGSHVIEGRDGFLYYAKTPRSPTSIWRVPIAGGGEQTLVVAGLSYSLNFAVGGRGLYFLSRDASVTDTNIEYFDLSTRKQTRLGVIGKRWWFGVALSPDEKWLMYSVVDRIGSNLMMVDSAW
jgi:Tol biopolymer transport system component